ncbi:adenylate/guanylate cyclase domain-containing protein [Rhizobium sp. LjRoot254]|uniref:adenylate/guanylate cyclase domain-containing protein n=1 Tax=Rhizobium sp. LjRoot254 TaxID=3342297 RepID=UPI003ECD4E87
MTDIADEAGQRPAGGLRVELLRFVALAILIGNLVLGADHGASIQTAVIVAYLAVSAASALTVLFGVASRWMRTGFVALDALAVALVLYAQLLQAPVDHTHNLTTTGLVVAFILLNHVGLSSDRKLVLVFSSIVIVSWIGFLAAMAIRHEGTEPRAVIGAFLNRDLGLAASFAFTAFAVYVVARDHGHTREHAQTSARRRNNLARFLSPHVVSQIEDASPALRMERRRAAIMFVDLRGFTSFAESATSKELTYVLSRYRAITSAIITRHGGTVDKFIGDGVMAVFGHVAPGPDDAEKALACALDLVDALAGWKRTSDAKGLPALKAGIGLHVGTVMGGILDAGGHSEFTVVGDAVNVAQRLQTVAKTFEASLVVSSDVFTRLSSTPPDVPWKHVARVEIPGRSLSLDVAYLPQAVDNQRIVAAE